VAWTTLFWAAERFNAAAKFFGREENSSVTRRARRCGAPLNQTRGALLRARAERFKHLVRAIFDRENDSEPSRFLRAPGEKFKKRAR
jgi:hypothetical protein